VGFSAEWLALRESADRAARDESLVRMAVEAAGPEPLIVDLGCGTGATWRALAPHLPAGARWCFVDNDPALLAAAAAVAGGAETVEADIADLAALPLERATLVTASALLDLVPESWICDLAQRLKVPFYAALSYSGTMRWVPESAHDAAVTDAFNRHQRGDKGLGPALGAEAGKRAASIFARTGFKVHSADSPWHLGPASAPLQRALTDGIAVAAGEAGMTDASAWGRHRNAMADHSHCDIGHIDILAVPPSTSRGSQHALS
jgi:SAM-dependent methyltransferase